MGADQWPSKREHAYAELATPNEVDGAIGRLRTELEQAARAFASRARGESFCGDPPLNAALRDRSEHVPEMSAGLTRRSRHRPR
jgi:hypothetical protein